MSAPSEALGPDMGGSPSMPRDHHVLIIGGGFAGITLANELLAAGGNFTLIDPKDVFYQNTASVRSCVEQDFAKKVCVPFEPRFKEHFRRGRVTSMDPADKSITMDTGDTVTYDTLVIATGSGGPFPFKTEEDGGEIVRQCERIRQEMASCARVVVVGGGAAGVEMAGEVATDMSHLKVTLVHPTQTLVSPEMTHKFQKRVQAILAELGVELVLGELVENLDEVETNRKGSWRLRTSGGKELQADMVLKCAGLTVNSDAYKAALGGCMDESGALRVNEHLQVEGHQHVFAIGDCNNVAEPKMAYLAGLQGTHAFKEIHGSVHNKASKAYTPDDRAFDMVLSVGRNNGLGQLKGGCMMPEMVVRKLKCDDLYVGKFWKEMGQTMPK